MQTVGRTIGEISEVSIAIASAVEHKVPPHGKSPATCRMHHPEPARSPPMSVASVRRRRTRA
jgi:hypothetical protein